MDQEKTSNEPAFRALSAGQIQYIYQQLLSQDFPLLERKPYSSVRRLVERGLYPGYALLAGEKIAAYALLARAEQGGPLLLDYLAVPGSEYKGQGLGSLLLGNLREQLEPGQYLLGEIESLTKAKTDQQRQERERRWGFYQRNGWRMSGVYNRLLGVDYDIITCGQAVSAAQLHRSLLEIYRVMFGPVGMKLILRMPPLEG